MRHENDGFGAVIDGIFDGGERADDALVVGDVLVGVERDVEVDLIAARTRQLSIDPGCTQGINLHEQGRACP